MAFDWKLGKYFLRVMHFDELIEGAGDETLTGDGDISAQKADSISDIDAKIDLIKANHVGETTLLAELDALKVDQASIINTNITGGGGTVTLANAVEALKADFIATVEAGQSAITGRPAFTARPHEDIKCAGTGVHLKSKDTNNPSEDTTKIICTSCAGWGATVELNTPTQQYPEKEDYSEEALV